MSMAATYVAAGGALAAMVYVAKLYGVVKTDPAILPEMARQSVEYHQMLNREQALSSDPFRLDEPYRYAGDTQSDWETYVNKMVANLRSDANGNMPILPEEQVTGIYSEAGEGYTPYDIEP